ncbi:MAG: hypothetical protein KGL31_04075 [candidate division NC10 bacterium]|nr:hypothetical protein [candidate division NC10 bacterium]
MTMSGETREMGEEGMQKMKMQVVFPRDLLREVDQVVSRRKRSEFIVEATRKELRRQRLEQAMEKAAGAWSDEGHPELSTLKEVHRWLAQLRAETGRRMEHLHG